MGSPRTASGPVYEFVLWPSTEFGNAGNTSKALSGLWGMRRGVFPYVKEVGLGF